MNLPTAAPFTNGNRVLVCASLVCAMLWPLNLALSFAVNILGNHQVPAALATIIALILLLAPPVGIITGIISAMRPTPWRRLAFIALSANILWLIGIFLISDLGATVVVWLRGL